MEQPEATLTERLQAAITDFEEDLKRTQENIDELTSNMPDFVQPPGRWYPGACDETFDSYRAFMRQAETIQRLMERTAAYAFVLGKLYPLCSQEEPTMEKPDNT